MLQSSWKIGQMRNRLRDLGASASGFVLKNETCHRPVEKVYFTMDGYVNALADLAQSDELDVMTREIEDDEDGRNS